MRKQVEESTAAESARRATGAAAERDRRGRDKAVHPRTIARDAVARPPRLLCRPARRVSPPRPRGLALSWRGSTGRLDAVPTAPLPSRLPAQRGAQLCGALRIRARRALALAQLKPGVEAAAHGERHAQTQRLARSAARLHPEVGRPARPALPPVKPVPHLKLVGLRRVDRRVSHQPRGVLAAPLGSTVCADPKSSSVGDAYGRRAARTSLIAPAPARPSARSSCPSSGSAGTGSGSGSGSGSGTSTRTYAE